MYWLHQRRGGMPLQPDSQRRAGSRVYCRIESLSRGKGARAHAAHLRHALSSDTSCRILCLGLVVCMALGRRPGPNRLSKVEEKPEAPAPLALGLAAGASCPTSSSVTMHLTATDSVP